MSSTTNKEIVRRYWEGRFNEKDTSVVDELLAPHARPEEQKAWLEAYYAACGDTALTLHELIAEEDLVAVHYTLEGTFEGEWLGTAPTGQRTRTSGMALCRVVDGKVVEDEVNYHGVSEVVQDERRTGGEG